MSKKARWGFFPVATPFIMIVLRTNVLSAPRLPLRKPCCISPKILSFSTTSEQIILSAHRHRLTGFYSAGISYELRSLDLSSFVRLAHPCSSQVFGLQPRLGPSKPMNINVASIANAILIQLYFHLETCQTVANNGTGLKQLCSVRALLLTASKI